ncbi:MAG: hypothetical protein GQ550_00065 [Gammaproteobacteria bacterium]|nr:hypothetical protein [Gammaproteobacteria bacterium]
MATVAATVCRMDAAFERTGMCLQRVSASVANSCLGRHENLQLSSVAMVSTCHTHG